MPITFSSRHLVAVWYLFALSLTLDQATKYAVETLMPLRTSIEVSSFFNLVHVLSPGAAFSFLADAGGWQHYLFVGLGGALLILASVLESKTNQAQQRSKSGRDRGAML